jgi:hypothetical protein
MPLIHSSSKKALEENMRTLHGEIGKSPHVQSREQAIAIALETQRRAAEGESDGGIVPERAMGGFNMSKEPHLASPWQTRMQARNMMHVGPVFSAVPGRTDHHPTPVPSGSYVIPADVVSGRGQGNTIAGARALQQMFRSGPYGSSLPHLGHGAGIPRGPRLKTAAASGGGKENGDGVGSPTPVNIAGGEVVLTPEEIMNTVHPDLDTAHKILDAWVLNERKNNIKTLKGLPGPAKD